MRIGIDARPLGRQRAGIGTYVYNIVKYLNATDRENEYYLFSCREIVVDFELNDNFHIVVDSFKVGTLWLFAKGKSLIEKYAIDLFWGTQHVLPGGKSENVKFILTIHDLAIFRLPDIGEWYNEIIQKIFVKGACKKADRIIAVSEATKYDIVDIFGIEAAKIQCVYNGGIEEKEKMAGDEAADVLTKMGIGNKYFLYIGTIEPRKNIETIIKAFNDFCENTNDEYQLVIGGGLGWKYADVISLIEKSPYKDKIIRTGFVDSTQKQALFTNTSAFIYPSLYEGFGIPILEAMNYEIPIITSCVSSIPEIGKDAVFYLDNVADEKKLAELMWECIELPDEKKQEIIQKQKIQREKFSWEKCAAQTKKVLLS